PALPAWLQSRGAPALGAAPWPWSAPVEVTSDSSSPRGGVRVLLHPQPWPLGGLEGPVCRVRMEQDGATPRHLEVVGVLSHYESSFIKLLRRRRSWDGNFPGTFGLCRAGEAAAAPHPLQRIHEHVLEPGRERFLVLHLEEGWWESPAGSEVEQRGEGCGAQGGDAELLLTGPGLERDQVGPGLGGSRGPALVPSLGRLGSSQAHERRWGHAGDPRPASSPLVAAAGAPLPRTEVQQLLFGSDDKCFTRMTPVLLLLDALASSSYQSAEGVLDMAPYPQLRSVAVAAAPGGSAQFLAILTRFIRQLLSSSSEPPPQPSAHHWLDFEAMETLPHQLLNLSEEAALERLVQSEEPSVLLLAQDMTVTATAGGPWAAPGWTCCSTAGRNVTAGQPQLSPRSLTLTRDPSLAHPALTRDPSLAPPDPDQGSIPGTPCPGTGIHPWHTLSYPGTGIHPWHPLPWHRDPSLAPPALAQGCSPAAPP
uniref:Anti-Mullerian hormone n=1 Tax=Cyanistes caeruleus TaxID=156563 RepID=A0A8C0VPH6_CYACU